MKKEQAEKYIESKLSEGDSLVGFFLVYKWPRFWLLVLFGPLFFLTTKVYFLAVTKKGIAFHRLGMLGGFKESEFFEFGEIKIVKLGGGMFQRPMKFILKSGRKMNLRAQLKGTNKVAKLEPGVQEYIESNISLLR